MEYDFGYVGKELKMMLENEKPMSAFCRATCDQVDEFSGQDFASHVKSGYLVKNVFYVQHGHLRLINTVFTRPSELWRFFCFKTLKKANCGVWSKEQEYLESFLLGYQSLPIRIPRQPDQSSAAP